MGLIREGMEVLHVLISGPSTVESRPDSLVQVELGALLLSQRPREVLSSDGQPREGVNESEN